LFCSRSSRNSFQHIPPPISSGAVCAHGAKLDAWKVYKDSTVQLQNLAICLGDRLTAGKSPVPPGQNDQVPTNICPAQSKLRSKILRLPEGAALLVAGRLQSGPEVAFLGPKCLVFLGVWPQSSRSSALGRMTIGRLPLVQAATSAAVRRSAAKSPGTVAAPTSQL
jgi:hypothetical protein